jgi:catechol 2,3-dioxygenase-like lactoylglutathione lyase family enzyme
MARIVHIALKVDDLEKATKFYEEVFGIYQLKTGHARGHTSRHMTEGTIDLALMTYDNEDEPEAKLAGPGPCIHHFGIEVEDREATMKKIVDNGGEIFSDPEEGALKFRAPDGNMAEVVGVGRYKLRAKSSKAKIVHLALKVMDLEKATKFYENVFGFRQLGDGYSRGHISRHMTDGNLDLALMHYDSEDEEEAKWAGAGPRIHHFGIEVADQDALAEDIKSYGGKILSKPGSGALKFRSPDGTLAEITKMGRYETIKAHGAKAVSPD